MDLVAFMVECLTIIIGFLIYAFVPGFTLLLVLFPRLSDMGSIRRLAWSVVLSLALVQLMYLVPLSGITLLNAGLGLCLFSAILLVTWFGELWYLSRMPLSPLPKKSSGSWSRLSRDISRFIHSRRDRFTRTAMTRVVWHESMKDRGDTVDHTYLIDIGMEIDINQIDENKWKFSNRALLRPPYPRTRYFELVIRESSEAGVSMVDDLEIYPVQAVKSPDTMFFTLRIRRGARKIAARIHAKTANVDIQWIYTHDFHLFAILYAQDTLDQIVDRVLVKLDEIVMAIQQGSRVPSHVEDTAQLRDETETVMEKPRKAPEVRVPTIKEVPVSYHRAPPPKHGDGSDRRTLQATIVRNLASTRISPGTFRPSDQKIPDIRIPDGIGVDKILDSIRDLQDEDWLCE
jgi:hypothetical protein